MQGQTTRSVRACVRVVVTESSLSTAHGSFYESAQKDHVRFRRTTTRILSWAWFRYTGPTLGPGGVKGSRRMELELEVIMYGVKTRRVAVAPRLASPARRFGDLLTVHWHALESQTVRADLWTSPAGKTLPPAQAKCIICWN